MLHESTFEYLKPTDEQVAKMADVRTAVKLYGEVAKDALEALEKLEPEDFDDWQAALKSERKGKFMGESAMDKARLCRINRSNLTPIF